MSTIVLSFSDMWHAMKQGRTLIFSAALCCGCFLFIYALLQPPTFTAEGIFKGGNQDKGTTLSRALELIGGGESYAASDDPKVFLKCYPVMEEVVKDLHLQLGIEEKKSGKRLKQIQNTLLAQRAQRLIKKRQPASPILCVPVTSELPLKEHITPLACVDLFYHGEMSWEGTLFFPGHRVFELRKNGILLGKGELGTPFTWNGGTFTLEGESNLKGKTFNLSFIPLYAAVKSLQKMVQVNRTKDHTALVRVVCRHPDRHLATQIVNKTMAAFQHYLREEGNRKIDKQLSYLQQRQEENAKSLERTLEEYKTYLEVHLDSGGMFLLENELEFLAHQQAKGRARLEEIAKEMQRLDHVLTGEHSLHFSDIIEKMRKKRGNEIPKLTQEAASVLIQQHERTFDLLSTELTQYDLCLNKLDDLDFDISTLSKVIDDPALRNRFEALHTLHHHLLDEKNWTSKEREQLHETLDTERLFLIKHIRDLKKGVALRAEVLEHELRRLQEMMLQLWFHAYTETDQSLRQLSLKASQFPEKWLTEKKLELNTKVHAELIESITKMIEAKNISYHLDYLSSAPLMQASLPPIPNSPNLVFYFCLGCFAGSFILILFFLFKEVWLGPLASVSTLKSMGLDALLYRPILNDLKEIHYHVKTKGKVLAVVGNDPSLARSLALLFSKSEEETDLFELKEGSEISLTHTVKRTLFYSSAPLSSVEVRELADLADHLIVILRNARIRALPPLPKNTLFVVEDSFEKALSLKELIPYVERLISLTFWKAHQKPRTPEPQQTENAAP